MQITLESTASKCLAMALVIGSLGSYFCLTTRNFVASRLAAISDERHLQLAVRLVPNNAEYHNSFGHILYQNNQLERAVEQYRIATILNPHDANYWIDLAGFDSVLGNPGEQAVAMDRAVEMDSKNPVVAWAAANFFLVNGQTDKALSNFRAVIEGSPNQAYAALQRCIHAADVDTIIRRALPPNSAAYLDFIDLLTTRSDSTGAARTWEALVGLRHSLNLDRSLLYVNYLISHQEVAQSWKVWQDIIQLNHLSPYLTGSDNLIVNAGFDSEIMNGGFDWRYRRHPNVEIALDPSEFHAGTRSLAVSFDGPGIADTGISQFIPLRPETDYEFSAYFKSEKMDGAGGPRFSIEDAYTGATYFQSDDLKDSDIWRETSGKFRTPSGVQLVVLRLVRVPAESPIRGKLWVDNFRLSEKPSSE